MPMYDGWACIKVLLYTIFFHWPRELPRKCTFSAPATGDVFL